MTDDHIEAVARAICVNLGFDPDESTRVRDDEACTPQEIADGQWCDYASYLPRWYRYRGHAAMAIATDAALKAALRGEGE